MESIVTLRKPRQEPRMLRLSLGLFGLAALTMLLAVAWLRFLVPAPRHAARVRVRDISWLQQPGR
jgi:hypothetical protein